MSAVPQVIVSLLALGMAYAFVRADRDSPTSRALAWFLFAVGTSIAVTSLIDQPLRHAAPYPRWGGIFALPEALAFVFANEWILRVRRTIPAGDLRTRFADNQLRLAQGLAVVYAMLALLFPSRRATEFVGAVLGGSELGAGFLMFALPLALSLLLGIGAGLVTLRRRPDISERQRLIAIAAAAPLMASGMVLPASAAPVLTTIGLLVFLVGGVQYHVIQGRRAQFMSRFLAPQVAQLVREQGLKSATRHQTLQISVVCADLRGFTAVSVDTDSRQVIQVLREYYDMVGDAVAQAGGTIKDQAGDGVLVLVGAPIGTADHAARAVALAQRIRLGGTALCARWSSAGLQLGVGVGVASGMVTVGVIGAASRLEYTAVGSAVNLASRLCAESAHGEVLVDRHSVELITAQGVRSRCEPREPLRLKGFVEPVQHFALAP